MKKKWLNVFMLIVGIFSLLFIWIMDKTFILKITREDGLIESISAFLYFLGFIIGFYSILKTKRLFFPIVWTLLCLLFLGEETSWFQRIFNYSVPGVEAINDQGEFNIHNLEFFKGKTMIVDGKINSEFEITSLLMSTQYLFTLGFFGYFLIIPILTTNKKIRNFLSRLGYVKSDFVLVILIVFGLSFLLTILANVEIKSAIAETREMLFAFFIFMYMTFYMRPVYNVEVK